MNASQTEARYTKVVRRVRYRAWLLRIIAWDGALPLLVFLVPHLVAKLFPNHRGSVEVLAVTLPIAAFFVRFYAGKREIDSNHCSQLVQQMQLAALCVAIFLLLGVDAVMILSLIMPKAALGRTDLTVLSLTVAGYLAFMTFAMYPGRMEERIPVEWRDVDPS